MNALGERIAALIEANGPIDVAQFMTMCLHDPKDGAYASRSPIGAGGDYVTSPEISQVFGEMCGLWVVQSWHNQGRPARPLLVELGPGRGTMMKDALRAISAAARKFLADAEIVLVEASPALRELQEKTLTDAPAKISWVGNFNEIAVERPLYLLANEFFDCLPIRQFVKKDGRWFEKMMTVKDKALTLALAPVPVRVLPAGFEAAPEGGVCESCPAATALAQDIGHKLAAYGGTALVIDYGYAVPEFRDTLQAVKRHKYADVLSAPGSCDLSAHVDFGALAAAAKKGGAATFGPREQGDFLADIGIEVRVQKLIMANAKQAQTIVGSVRRLIAPKEMGALFKVLALTPASAPKPPGF
jgi:NADH dehydrogenase [ubiquinone] 1 alpha subcomplex assembly factor 7